MASTVAPGCPVHADFDPLSPRYLEDPFAVLRELPASGAPVFYAPAIDYYVVTRYEDIEAIFLDHETFSAGAAQLPLVALSEEASTILLGGGHRPAPSMVSLDPPEHTRVRRHTARAFTPRRVAELEDTIRATVSDLLDAIDPGEPFDLVATLTFPLPATIVFSLIGVPHEDYGRLKRWCGYRAGLTFGRPRPEEQVEHAENIVAYRRYLRELVAEREQRRADDLTSALIDIHDEDPDAFTLDEIASILFSLSFAGHETTNYLIGNLARRLLEDRTRWDRVVADPATIPAAVEETLRFDPSVCVWRRVTTQPARVGGVELPAGAKLFLWLAAAGRDASVFPEPDSFDLDRDNARRHLAFGRGIHYCLGASLGKLEAELALAELARRFPGLALVEDQELTFHPNISFRGPRALWVRAGS
jgi:cytochrome P450